MGRSDARRHLHPHQPGRQRPATVEGIKRAKSPQECFLRCIFRFQAPAQHTIGNIEHDNLMAAHQLGKGVQIACLARNANTRSSAVDISILYT